jgi:hypothetical protein
VPLTRPTSATAAPAAGGVELDPPTYTAPSAGDYVVGGYHDFDGVDEYIDFGRITSMERDTGEPFTISVWCLCTTNPGVHIGIEDTNNRILLYEGAAAGFAHISIKFAGSNMDKRTSAVLPSGWNHVVVTCDGVNAAGVQIFLNGVQQTSYTTSGAYPTASATWGASTKVVIGGLPSLAGYYFEGQIAEVAMWSTDQSANVAAIYNSRARHDLMDLATPPDLFYAPLTIYGDNPGSGGSVAELVANNDGTGVNMETADAVGQTPTTVTSTLTKALDIATSVVTTTKVEDVVSGLGTGSSFP